MDAQKLQCAKCAASIAGQLYVVCTTCKQAYDLACANIPEDTYHHRHKETWVCDDCKAGKHPPTGVCSSPDLQSVPHPPCAENVTDSADINNIDLIRQIVYLETTDLLQRRLAAMISGAVTSLIIPIIDNSMGKISDQVAKIEVKMTSLETGQRHSVVTQNSNPAITNTNTKKCVSSLFVPVIFEEEVSKSGTVTFFRGTEIHRDDNFGSIRIFVRNELTSIMDERVTNMISLAVADQITPIIQISIGNLDGKIAALEDKLKLLERSHRRIQTSSKPDPTVSYAQTGATANPRASNLQTGTSSRATPGTSHPRTETRSSSTSHSPSTDHNEKKQNLGHKTPPNTSNTDDSLYVDDVRTIIRDELSNVLNERLTKTINKAIAEQIAPAIESSFTKLSGRVAKIEERINKLESTPRLSVENGNVSRALNISAEAFSEKRDGLDHEKGTSKINIDKETFKSTTAVSDNNDNDPGKLGSSSRVNVDKMDDRRKLKSAPKVSVVKINSSGELKVLQESIDAKDQSGESVVDEKNNSSTSSVHKKKNSVDEENNSVDEENNNSGMF